MTADKSQIEKIVNFFEPQYFYPVKDYVVYLIKYDDAVITIYTTGKVVFAGKNGEYYYNLFKQLPDIVLPQAGSDEVGTGDFYGPVCVCASYVDADIYQSIQQYNLTDSKQLTDEYMMKIGPVLMKEVPHSLLVLDNEKYNQIIEENNMNRIKARMHNGCYNNLIKKGYPLPKLTVVDDFCGESLYYRYLYEEKQVVKGLTFETKAESKYIAVAIGSIISRYAFLTCYGQLNEKYGLTFPKGAGEPVDEFTKVFIEKYGMEELKKVAKCNFRNYRKLLTK